MVRYLFLRMSAVTFRQLNDLEGGLGDFGTTSSWHLYVRSPSYKLVDPIMNVVRNGRQ
jgi:hypothetical protein